MTRRPDPMDDHDEGPGMLSSRAFWTIGAVLAVVYVGFAVWCFS